MVQPILVVIGIASGIPTLLIILTVVAFCLKTVAVCLKTVAFCFKIRCILCQSLLRFVSRLTDIKRMDADDQAIQTILLGLPEDVYADVDSCETAKEIWERVHQMMKGSDIGEQ
nr:ribonuclease H-like domain-containing protein [Tanacetum cinerariifolium]